MAINFSECLHLNYCFQEYSFFELFKFSAANLSYSTATGIMILFFTVVLMTSFLFKALKHDMEKLIDNQSSLGLMDFELQKWKKRHLLVVQLVDLINDCFGMVILLIAGHGFISFIHYSFETVSYFQKGDNWMYYYLTVFLHEFLVLASAIFASHILQYEVIRYLQTVSKFPAS